MDNDGRRKLEMAVHVRNFFRANPFGSPKPDAIVAKFEVRVERGLVLVVQQQDGLVGQHAATVHKKNLRRRIRKGALHHLSRVAQAATGTKPELVEKFRQLSGNVTEQAFRAAVGSIATDVKANRELFAEHGMLDGAFEEFTLQLEEYDRVSTEGSAARRAHTGARVELKALTSDLIRMVRQLDGMVRYRWRDNLDVLGAWESARNVPWPKNPPVTGVVPPAKKDGGTTA